jgi:DNA-binding response OmpR family regulator
VTSVHSAMQGSPILVVDDDADCVAMISRVLQTDGYRVIGETDPRNALAVIERDRPCLLIVDLMMPHMDGETFLEAVRARLNHRMPPIVIVTASSTRREAGARSGASATLEKPFEMQDVRDLAARFAA